MRGQRGSSFRRQMDFMLGVPLLWVLGLLRRRRKLPARVRSVVLLQTAAIGDTLFMAGAIRLIREHWPQARLTLALGPDNRRAADLLPPVDEIKVVQVLEPWRALAQLRELRPDVLIDYGSWPRINALLVALSGAMFTIGFRTQGQARHFAYDAAVPHSNTRHELLNQRALLSPCADSESWDHSLTIPAGSPPADLPAGRYVVFHPWASGSGKQLKEWPSDYWCALGAWCHRRKLAVVITGGKEDAGPGERLLKALLAREPDLQARSYAGKCSIAETVLILKGAEAVVSVNTGIMHLAALIDVATIGLHGPTNPDRWGPIGAKTVALAPREGQRGYLNLGFEFPANVTPCMKFLPVDDVTATLSKWL